MPPAALFVPVRRKTHILTLGDVYLKLPKRGYHYKISSETLAAIPSLTPGSQPIHDGIQSIIYRLYIMG